MFRSVLYVLGGLALLVIVFLAVVLIGVAMFGLASVRSDVFALFTGAYILIGAPVAVAASIALAMRRRDRA